MRRLGVLGTMVWDRIYARDIRADPVEARLRVQELDALAPSEPADVLLHRGQHVGNAVDHHVRLDLHLVGDDHQGEAGALALRHVAHLAQQGEGELPRLHLFFRLEVEREREVAACRATPLARRLARENGIALSSVAGSGPHGRIVRADVEAAVKVPPSGLPAISPSRGEIGSFGLAAFPVALEIGEGQAAG